jgi:stage IV sporulation protein FB
MPQIRRRIGRKTRSQAIDLIQNGEHRRTRLAGARHRGAVFQLRQGIEDGLFGYRHTPELARPWRGARLESGNRNRPGRKLELGTSRFPVHGEARMIRFHIFGFPVTVELWFWLTCLLLGGGFRSDAYASVANLAGLAIYAIIVFFSILVHELGHATVGRNYGATPEIVLHGFGGAAIMHGSRFNRRQDLLVTAAGPLASLLLGTLALLLLLNVHSLSVEVRELLSKLVWINYFWTAINLLPIQPLDGGLLLRTALGDRRLQLTCTVGFVCAVAVAILAFRYGGVFLTLFMALLAFENWRMRQR